jgi:hypothetical protein
MNQVGLKLNVTHHLLMYADVNILGRSLHTTTKDTDSLVVASKDIRIEVNADKPKYMVISRDQNAGRIHSMKTDFEKVEQFKYLGTTLTNKILFRKKLRAFRNQGMLAIIRCIIFCRPGSYLKIRRLRYTEV